MGKIIPMPANFHISSEKSGGLRPGPNGYNKIPEEIIAEFFKILRGGGGPDAFIIRRYSLDPIGKPVGKELMRGCVPTRGKTYDAKLVRENQRDLQAELDRQAPIAFETIKGRIARNYEYRHHEKNMVFICCNQGLMACGWYDSANTSQKGLLACCYMLYVFGSINGNADATLLRAVYEYLPFESRFTSIDAEKVERAILKYAEKAAAGKN
jgi:hypothetical protein